MNKLIAFLAALFSFKKPLLDSALFDLTFTEPQRKPRPTQDELIAKARLSLIQLSNNTLERIKNIDPDSVEYDRELGFLTGYIRLKQQLDNLTEGVKTAEMLSDLRDQEYGS